MEVIMSFFLFLSLFTLLLYIIIFSHKGEGLEMVMQGHLTFSKTLISIDNDYRIRR